MSLDLALFYLLAIGLLASALLMVAARSVVHAVIAMVANFALTGVLYLILHAPFLFVVQITVYAGAIMVLFLFVVMILGRRDAGLEEPLVGQRLWGIGALAVLGGLLVWAVSSTNGLAMPPIAAVPPDFGSPTQVGEALFRRFALPFELMGLLLLIGVLGAVVLGQFRRGEQAGDDQTEGEGGG